jgi:uncharacterized protein (DUF362 family)
MDEQVERAVALCGAQDLVRPGDSVLVKPNLHAVMPYTTASTTNPAMAAAVVRWCRRRGAARVIAGDGPFHGLKKARRIFTETGMAEAVEEAGGEWALLDEHEFRVMDQAEEGVPSQIGVTRFAFECSKIINLALLKTHLDTMVTLGMKNLKGCVRPKDKAAFHTADVDRSLVALCRIVRPHLTIIDGTMGMEGMGPAVGRPAGFGHLFAGSDLLATDTVAAAAMGFGPDEIRLHRLAREAGIGCGDLERIEVAGVKLSAIRRRFERPYEEAARTFGDLKILAEGACSGCKLSFYRALKALAGARPGAPSLGGRTLVLGRSESDDPGAIFFGQCAFKASRGRKHLKGCPPALDAVSAFLAKAMREP